MAGVADSDISLIRTPVDIEEGDSSTQKAVRTIDFDGDQFNLTTSAGREANIVINSSSVTMKGADIDVGEVNFDPILETELDAISELEAQITDVTDFAILEDNQTFTGDNVFSSTFTVTLATVVINGTTYYWPSADGSSGQVLHTNGSGTLSWAADDTGGGGGGSGYDLEPATVTIQVATITAPSGYADLYISTMTNIVGADTGIFDEYDLTIGDQNSPDYGGIRIGNAGIYRTNQTQGGNLDWGGAFILRNEGNLDAGNDPGIEFALLEQGNTARFVIPESGSGNATAMIRSVTIAGPWEANNDVVTCTHWGFNDLDCDTSGTGADLGIQDDLQLGGTIYAHSQVTVGELVAIGSTTIANAACIDNNGSDRLYHDTDCDSVKDAGEEFIDAQIGSEVQAYDADLDDLADGSLTGSKVGSGIAGDNITDNTIDASELEANSVGASELASTAIQAGDYPAAGIDGDDVNSNIAGRSLSLTAASPDTLDIDSEIYTDNYTVWLDTPTATDDLENIYCTLTNTYTITKMTCESDGTVNMDLQVDDGTPADVNGADLACDSTPPTDTSMGGDATLSAGECLDLAIASVSGGPSYVSFTFEMTKND